MSGFPFCETSQDQASQDQASQDQASQDQTLVSEPGFSSLLNLATQVIRHRSPTRPLLTRLAEIFALTDVGVTVLKELRKAVCRQAVAATRLKVEDFGPPDYARRRQDACDLIQFLGHSPRRFGLTPLNSRLSV
jgi:hypothetical protein